MQMPMGWRWLNRISPSTWIIYGLAVDQLGQNQQMMTTPEGTQQTVADFMTSFFGYEYSFRWCVRSTYPPRIVDWLTTFTLYLSQAVVGLIWQGANFTSEYLCNYTCLGTHWDTLAELQGLKNVACSV
jgi:hypothetical protein